MNNDSIDRYLKKVSKIIYDSKKRNSVKKELADMIEDFTEDYMEMGMTEEEAKAEAVKQMGAPEETGHLFNKIYHVKYDWKIILYMLFWAIAVRGFRNLIMAAPSGGFDWPEYAWWWAAIIFIPIGFIVSVLEKWYDLPFFYAWAENWKGMGISNSGMILGVAIGLMPVSLQNWFLAFALITIVLMVQRSYMVEKRNQKEQMYLWEVVEALEDFEYKGKVQFEERKLKVQIKKGSKAIKGEKLLIVGLNEFQIIVDKM